MSEDIRNFVSYKGPRWQLSAKDDVLLVQLHSVVWQWLWACETAKVIIAAGHILQALENLISDGSAPGSGECEINLRLPGQDGFGAHLSISPEALMFSLVEYVWMGEQGHDHGSIRDPEGRPFHLEFTPEGSFDAEKFAFWLRYAEQAAPSSPADPVCTHASWYSEVM